MEFVYFYEQTDGIALELPDVSEFSDRCLQQNGELIAYIARISEEKLALRKTVSNIEDEAWQLKHRDRNVEEVTMCQSL